MEIIMMVRITMAISKAQIQIKIGGCKMNEIMEYNNFYKNEYNNIRLI